MHDYKSSDLDKKDFILNREYVESFLLDSKRFVFEFLLLLLSKRDLSISHERLKDCGKMTKKRRLLDPHCCRCTKPEFGNHKGYIVCNHALLLSRGICPLVYYLAHVSTQSICFWTI